SSDLLFQKKYLTGILIRDDIIIENDEGLTAILEDTLSNSVVTLLGICVFFDILISDEEPPDDCEVKLSHRKKSYLQIYTNSTEERKKAIKAIQDSNFETASDDMWSFHHKVTRENGIQLSE
ncbi:10771_t:CDS:2, partial [Funneliformis geosporum]